MSQSPNKTAPDGLPQNSANDRASDGTSDGSPAAVGAGPEAARAGQRRESARPGASGIAGARDERAARRAEALRANLRRRKDQSRARRDTSKGDG